MLYVFAILSMSLPVTTTIGGQWLNSLISHGNNTHITANGQMIIHVSTKYTVGIKIKFMYCICSTTVLHGTLKNYTRFT